MHWQVLALENWSPIMIQAMWCTGTDEQPLYTGGDQWLAIYFVVFVILGVFFILNMVIGVSINQVRMSRGIMQRPVDHFMLLHPLFLGLQPSSHALHPNIQLCLG